MFQQWLLLLGVAETSACWWNRDDCITATLDVYMLLDIDCQMIRLSVRLLQVYEFVVHLKSILDVAAA